MNKPRTSPPATGRPPRPPSPSGRPEVSPCLPAGNPPDETCWGCSTHDGGFCTGTAGGLWILKSESGLRHAWFPGCERPVCPWASPPTKAASPKPVPEFQGRSRSFRTTGRSFTACGTEPAAYPIICSISINLGAFSPPSWLPVHPLLLPDAGFRAFAPFALSRQKTFAVSPSFELPSVPPPLRP
jgi:hypothetical protein